MVWYWLVCGISVDLVAWCVLLIGWFGVLALFQWNGGFNALGCFVCMNMRLVG